MYENEEIDKLSAIEPVEDQWYNNRKDAVIKTPNKYHGWKVVNGELYRFRSNPMIEDIIEDLDAWKLVVPKDHQSEITTEVHETPEAGHLDREKQPFVIIGRGCLKASQLLYESVQLVN